MCEVVDPETTGLHLLMLAVAAGEKVDFISVYKLLKVSSTSTLF